MAICFITSPNRGERNILNDRGVLSRPIDGGRLIRTNGDIILGGIFPMHEHNINKPDYPCGMVKEEKGF